MAIDINSLSGNLQGGRVRNTGSAPGKDDAAKAQNNPGASQAAKEDSVRISDEAKSLSEKASSSPDIDQDKVSAIRSAIDDGSFSIDYKALARNIVQFESEL